MMTKGSEHDNKSLKSYAKRKLKGITSAASGLLMTSSQHLSSQVGDLPLSLTSKFPENLSLFVRKVFFTKLLASKHAAELCRQNIRGPNFQKVHFYLSVPSFLVLESCFLVLGPRWQKT